METKKRDIKAILVILLTVFINLYSVLGQNLPVLQTIKSPEVAAVAKVIDIPVSTYTGIPNISIPLYTINLKGLNIPILLTYNGGGGIKVDEEASMVGLGWRLSYGGSISRTLQGHPDEKAFFEKQTLATFFQMPSFDQDPTQAQRAQYIFSAKDARNYQIDLAPDEFNYSVEGYSGKFMYKQSDSRFVLFPKEDITIKYNKSSLVEGKIDTWELTTPDGIKYSFGADGTSTYQSLPAPSEQPSLLNNPIDNMWSVKKVSTPAGESINYTYLANNYTSFSRSTGEYFDYYNRSITALPPATQNTFTEPIIQSISFPNGSISFISSNRVDLSSKKIDEIVITNSFNEVVRRVKFFYNYFYGNFGYVPLSYRVNSTDDLDNKRLRLDSVLITSADGSMPQTYRFNYYANNGQLPSKYSYAQDCWGFFNGANNSTWVPKFFGDITNGANRKVNGAVNNVFALQSITYPTGGKTEFTYESNIAKAVDYSDFENMLNGGNYVNQTASLTIGSSVPNATINGENFYYSTFVIPDNGGYPAENGWSCVFGASISGANADQSCLFNYATFRLEKVISTNNYQSIQFYKYCNGINPPVQQTTLPQLSPGTYRLTISTNFPPIYTQNHSLSGLQVSVTWRNYVPGSTTGYINVGGLRIKNIKYYANNITVAKNISYSYTDDNGNPSGSIYSVPYFIQYVNETVPEASGQIYLRVYGNPILPYQSISGSYIGYTQVKEETVSNNNPAENQVVKYTYSYVPPIYRSYASPTVYLDGLSEAHEWQYGKLISIEYLKNGQLLKKESYTYPTGTNTNEDFVDEILVDHISWASFNNEAPGSISTPIDGFTDDYALTENTGSVPVVLGGIYNAHFIYGVKYSNASSTSPINPTFAALTLPYKKHYTGFDKIQSKTTTLYDGSTPITQKENFFYEKAPNLYQLTKTEVINSKNEVLQQQLFYPTDFLADPVYNRMVQLNIKNKIVREENYRNGTFLTAQRTNYFDWGNNVLMPKSFETQTQSNASEVRSQYNAYDNTGNLLSISNGAIPPICYIYSYQNQYPVAEIKGADYTTIVNVLGGASAVNNFSNSSPTDVQVNNFVAQLRNASSLKDAQITSYTYKPLVGITSETNAGGITFYYEYDGMGRLKLIRDQDNNIIKEYDYKYQVQ